MKHPARFLCTVTLILFGLTALRAQEREEDGFLIVEIQAAGRQITPGAEVLYQEGEVFLPAQLLSSELEIALQADADGRATGNFNNTRVEIAPEQKTARKGGESFYLTPQDCVQAQGVWYYGTRLLSRLLDLQFDFDYLSQTLHVSSAGAKLPIEERNERQRRLRAFDAQQTEENEDTPVEWDSSFFQPPFLDAALRYNAEKDEDGNKTGFLGYSANAFAVTGGFDTEAYVYDMAPHAPATVALKTSRYQPDGKMLGLFKKAEAGDILSFSNPAVNYAQAGRGFKLSSSAEDFAESKTFNIRDALPPGWDVELYRNNELMGYQRSSQDGFFEFRDIPLLLGENVFRLAFYGPQGQRKEQILRYFFMGGLIDQGTWDVQAGFIEKNKYLIETRKNVPSYQQGYNGQLTAAYGVSDQLTLNAGVLYDSVAQFKRNGFERQDKFYAAAGAVYSLGGMFFNLQSVYDPKEKAAAADASWQTVWNGWDLFAQNIYYDGTVTERNILSDDKIRNDTSVRLNKTLSLFRWRIPVNYTFRRFITSEGDSQIEHTAGLYKTVWRSWYAALSYQYVAGLNDARWNLLNLDVNQAAAGYSLRANVSYDFIVSRVRETGVSAYKDITERLNAGLHYKRVSRSEWGRDYENRYGGSLNWKTKYGYWSADAGCSQTGAYYAYIGLNLSFLYNPFTKFVHTSADKLYGTGAIAAEVFLDENRNGKQDPGEKPLPEAMLNITPSPMHPQQTIADNKGNALITLLRPYQPYDVQLNLNKTDGQFTPAPGSAQRRVAVRPGQLLRLAYPVSGSGDIEGTVFLEEPGKSVRPLPGIRLRLTDEESGKVFATHISEFDGYYLFESLPFGRYQVQADAGQLQELGFQTDNASAAAIEKHEQIIVKNITVSVPGVKNGTAQTGIPPKIGRKPR